MGSAWPVSCIHTLSALYATLSIFTGMFELLQMADDVGAKPLLVVNAGCSKRGRADAGHLGHVLATSIPRPYGMSGRCVSGVEQLAPYVRDALDAIEYASGELDAPHHMTRP